MHKYTIAFLRYTNAHKNYKNIKKNQGLLLQQMKKKRENWIRWKNNFFFYFLYLINFYQFLWEKEKEKQTKYRETNKTKVEKYYDYFLESFFIKRQIYINIYNYQSQKYDIFDT